MSNSLDNVFQGIYKSIVEAQNTIEQHYVGEIKEDYFDKDGNPYMIEVKLPHGDNGEMKTVNIPVITLVPHNGMAIKEVEIDMKVALSPGDSEEINKSDVTKKKPSRIKRFLRGPFTQTGVRALSRGSVFATPFIETGIQGYNAYKALKEADKKADISEPRVDTALGKAPISYYNKIVLNSFSMKENM